MKLAILGATGATGLEIVGQATARGHSVTAIVRSPDRLREFDHRITVRQANLLDSAELEQVLRGSDAIVTGFGPRILPSKAEAHLLERFARAVTKAMVRARVRRVVVESVAPLFKGSMIPPWNLLGTLLFPALLRDAAAMEKIFQESELDWTMVRPPRLTDKPYTGKYRIQEGQLPRFAFQASRADVADLMIKAVEYHLSIRKIVGVCS
jgi:putative NADH-flavin reductase